MNAPLNSEELGLPPADQVGFVVKDMDRWVEHYTPMFGPFSFMESVVEQADFRGRKADVSLRLAFGRSGDLEIEFIEWLEGESPHSEFIQSGREGMHHLRFRVDNCSEWVAKMERHGYRNVWQKRMDNGIEFVYMERDGDPTMIEFLTMPEAFLEQQG